MEERAQQVLAVIVVFTILGTVVLGLRLWTRFAIIRAAGAEDWVLMASWLNALATSICIGLQVRYGLGRHGIDLSIPQLTKLGLNIYISIITYCASIGLTKLAILMQYQRVFMIWRFQIVCWLFIAIILIHAITTVVLSIVPCHPIKKYWIPPLPGKCLDRAAGWMFTSITNIVTDFMIILLPIPVVKSLRLPKKQKLLLIGVFSMGGVVCIVSIVRLHSLKVGAESKDPSYDNAPVAMVSLVEIYVALMCASLPAMKSLLAKWFSSILSTYGTRGASNGSGQGGQKRASILPGLNPHSIALSTMRGRDGQEKLDDGASEDQIKVVTRVDVSVSHGSSSHKETLGSVSAKDDRESSTESLFRDGRYGV